MSWLLAIVLVSAAAVLVGGKVLGLDFPFLVWLALRGRKPSHNDFDGKDVKPKRRAVGA